MQTLILKAQLELAWCQTQALCLIPTSEIRPVRAIYAHGYTANKADCLPWAVRASENGIPSVIFDWPGHYLGGFNEVKKFSDFTQGAPDLFAQALKELNSILTQQRGEHHLGQIVLGGHSLGALMAIKALKHADFAEYLRLAVGVGIGLNNQLETHLFDTEFYQKTLSIRRQLVSPALDSDFMFPWIREEKTRLNISYERIHLITGEDDLVVGVGGMERLADALKLAGNHVTTFEPKKLPHHEPTLAAPHINAFLKQELKL
jgi:alpha-beta hydrolase superfamily lysophospholipase